MAADGLHNITGRVNPSGTVTIWAITSTVSGGGDQGADPNKLVEITDPLNAARPATGENFRTIRTAGLGEMLWGVWFTPRIGGRRLGASSSVAPGTSRVSSMAFRVPGGRGIPFTERAVVRVRGRAPRGPGPQAGMERAATALQQLVDGDRQRAYAPAGGVVYGVGDGGGHADDADLAEALDPDRVGPV